MTVKGPINIGHNDFARINRPNSLNQCLEKLKFVAYHQIHQIPLNIARKSSLLTPKYIDQIEKLRFKQIHKGA